jgi:hypothetical protein
MPWATNGLNARDLRVVKAFYSDLALESVAALAIVVLCAASLWLRRSRHRRPPITRVPSKSVAPLLVCPEPSARRFLRISFGILWVFDGLLQAQPLMPLYMARQVVEPAAAASPTGARRHPWTWRPMGRSVSVLGLEPAHHSLYAAVALGFFR